MRNLLDPDIDRFRMRTEAIIRHYGSAGNAVCGAFMMPADTDDFLRVIASNAGGWDHVSVSLAKRCPTWAEMERVKRLFFKPEEMAMQLHVPVEAHINFHNFCLHLWRPHKGEIPRPPGWMVA